MQTNFDDNILLQQKRQRTLAVLLFFPTRHCVYCVYHCSDNTQDGDYGFVLRYPVTTESEKKIREEHNNNDSNNKVY